MQVFFTILMLVVIGAGFLAMCWFLDEINPLRRCFKCDRDATYFSPDLPYRLCGKHFARDAYQYEKDAEWYDNPRWKGQRIR
jgi:hypothetical protein